MRHGHHHGAPHDLGEGGEHLVADRRAPVLADEQARIAAAEHPDQLADIHRQRADIEVARPRDLGGRIAAQPRCCHAEPSPGRGSQLMVPCMRRVRPAVQQHDQRPAAPLQVSEPQPVGRDPAFPQQTRHQPIIGRPLRPGTQGTTRCSSGTPAPRRADRAGSRREARRLRPVTARAASNGCHGSPVSPATANTQRDRETDLLMRPADSVLPGCALGRDRRAVHISYLRVVSSPRRERVVDGRLTLGPGQASEFGRWAARRRADRRRCGQPHRRRCGALFVRVGLGRGEASVYRRLGERPHEAGMGFRPSAPDGRELSSPTDMARPACARARVISVHAADLFRSSLP